jgi:hypothetical protein
VKTDETDIFKGVGVLVSLQSPDDFLKVKETLTRIGISSKKDKILYQSCHILHKQGQYAIVHFKELFKLDGKTTDLSDKDLARRNSIAKLLGEWGLISVLEKDFQNWTPENFAPIQEIKILPFKEKNDWELVAKYNIGKKKVV